MNASATRSPGSTMTSGTARLPTCGSELARSSIAGPVARRCADSVVCAAAEKTRQLFVSRALRVSRPERSPARRARRLRSSHPTADGSASGPTGCSGKSPCRAVLRSISAKHRCRFSQSGGPRRNLLQRNICRFRCGHISERWRAQGDPRPHCPPTDERIALHSELPGRQICSSPRVRPSASYLEILSRKDRKAGVG